MNGELAVWRAAAIISAAKLESVNCELVSTLPRPLVWLRNQHKQTETPQLHDVSIRRRFSRTSATIQFPGPALIKIHNLRLSVDRDILSQSAVPRHRWLDVKGSAPTIRAFASRDRRTNSLARSAAGATTSRRTPRPLRQPPHRSANASLTASAPKAAAKLRRSHVSTRGRSRTWRRAAAAKTP